MGKSYGVGIGINTYPTAPLSGCVNDIQAMAESKFVSKSGFSSDTLRLLLDSRATAANIRERLKWLVNVCQPGDQALFWYSGHGTRVPARNDDGEVDGMDDVLVPLDFDWNREDSFVSDNEIYDIFKHFAHGVKVLWIADCCHSGTMTRAFLPPMQWPNIFKKKDELPNDYNPCSFTIRPEVYGPIPAIKPGAQPVDETALFNAIHTVSQVARVLPQPFDIAWRGRSKKAVKTKDLRPELDVCLISGCAENETSADAYFVSESRYRGALSYYLLPLLDEGILSPKLNSQYTADVLKLLKDNGYSQTPKCTGLRAECAPWGACEGAIVDTPPVPAPTPEVGAIEDTPTDQGEVALVIKFVHKVYELYFLSDGGIRAYALAKEHIETRFKENFRLRNLALKELARLYDH